MGFSAKVPGTVLVRAGDLMRPESLAGLPACTHLIHAAGGYRLGYGGGFYDRMLASLEPKPFTVGLGFGTDFVDDFEPEPHDMPLDAILNDHGIVWPV